MSKYRIASPTPPSELFLDSLQGGGSHYLNCGFCGRDHYCSNSDAVYADDLEEYNNTIQKATEENPDGVILHYEDDYVYYKELNGLSFVVDCPCNGLAMYEKFIWTDRNSIRRYLGNRVTKELELAMQEETRNKLAGIEGDSKPTTKDIWEGTY